MVAGLDRELAKVPVVFFALALAAEPVELGAACGVVADGAGALGAAALRRAPRFVASSR